MLRTCVSLSTAFRPGDDGAEFCEGKIGLGAVVPCNGDFGADELDVLRCFQCGAVLCEFWLVQNPKIMKNHDYLFEMIKCDKDDERVISDAHDAFLTLNILKILRAPDFLTPPRATSFKPTLLNPSSSPRASTTGSAPITPLDSCAPSSRRPIPSRNLLREVRALRKHVPAPAPEAVEREDGVNNIKSRRRIQVFIKI